MQVKNEYTPQAASLQLYLFARMTQMIEQGTVRAVIQQRIAAERTPEAFTLAAAGHVVGKISRSSCRPT